MSTILSALRSRRDARLRGDETGFSLIELMIVLLIIAILLAVAIPTYLSARNRAEDRVAQETLAHVLVSAKTAYTSQGDYNTYPGGATSMSAYLAAENPGVTVVSIGNTTPSVDAVNSVSEGHGKQQFYMAAYAPDGRCFFLLDVESASSGAITSGYVSGAGTYYGESTGQTSCTASASAPTSGWQTSWAAAAAKA